MCESTCLSLGQINMILINLLDKVAFVLNLHWKMISRHTNNTNDARDMTTNI